MLDITVDGWCCDEQKVKVYQTKQIGSPIILRRITMDKRRIHSGIEHLVFQAQEYNGELEGIFVWGQSRNHLFDKFYSADEFREQEVAKRELKTILIEDPQFIDAYNSLGWWEIDVHNYGNAKRLFEMAFNIGNELIPKNYSGRILWGFTENRPFLRAMHGLGISHLYIQEFDKATKLFDKILNYNPNDNQGSRALTIHCKLALGQFNSIIEICKQYPNDTMADTVYGQFIAYYRLGDHKKARFALKNAVKLLPLVAKELIKKKHKEVKGRIPGTITSGGEDEAYEYWKRVGQYWTDPNLIEFLREGIEKYYQKK